MISEQRSGGGWCRVTAAAGAAVAASAVFAGVPAAAQAAASPTPSWPQFQGNAAHTGYEAAEKSVNEQNVSQLSVAWTHPLGPVDSVNSEVVVSGGTAYVAAGDAVTALDAANGTQLWQATLPANVLGTPSVQGGLVLVAYDPHRRPHGFVAALDATSGATVWSARVGRLNPPSLSQGTTVTTTATRAYVSQLNDRVDALSLSNGHQIWQSPPIVPSTSCPMSAPSVSGGFVVVGDQGTAVTALRSTNGTVAWSDALGTQCGFAAEAWLPAISNGTVYAGWLGGIAAISLDSGTVLWDNKSLGAGFFPLSVTAGEVIGVPQQSGGSETLVALSRSDGSVLWQSAANEPMVATFGSLAWSLTASSPSAVRAVAFNAATGHKVYSGAAFFDDTQSFAPVVDAGHVYVNTGTEVMCLALPS